MKIDMTDLLNSITENLKRIDYIKPEEIPNIDLYMDQVTTFMDEHLAGTKRRDEDKILTKTMINNYSKIIFFLRPSRKNILKNMYFFLYLFTTLKAFFLSKILKPYLLLCGTNIFQTRRRLASPNCIPKFASLKIPYQAAFRIRSRSIRKFILCFSNIEDDADQKELRLFAFICSLSFDVYLKKL